MQVVPSARERPYSLKVFRVCSDKHGVAAWFWGLFTSASGPGPKVLYNSGLQATPLFSNLF